MAKIAKGPSRERFYRVKTEAVLQFARTFPEKIWFTSLERKPLGKWLFAITGVGLGSIHLLSESPLEILNLIQPASFL
ncbi:hypothetical protein OAV41_03475, partial [Planctomycetota bacterium]|nr:hypothetical protein [Planctomycetota bacterium]